MLYTQDELVIPFINDLFLVNERLIGRCKHYIGQPRVDCAGACVSTESTRLDHGNRAAIITADMTRRG